MQNDAREGHGWWPYVVPYVAFLLLSEIGARMPDGAAPFLLAIKPVGVLALVVWFRSRGAYPEWWRNPPTRMTGAGFVQDVAVGLALTAVWFTPYLLIPSIRPEPGGEFDPAMAGAAWVPLILGLRLFG
jgi:hypothetical protein